MLSLYSIGMAKSIKIHSRINNNNTRLDTGGSYFVKDMFDEVIIYPRT